MIFACGRCRTRYKIPDEKLKGRLLKVRCRSCGAIIAVKDPHAPSPSDNAAARETSDWFVALDGQQHGPMTETALIQLIVDGAIAEGTFCWNPELPDWKPIEEVGQFEQWRARAAELIAAAEVAAAEVAAAEAAAAEAAKEAAETTSLVAEEAGVSNDPDGGAGSTPSADEAEAAASDSAEDTVSDPSEVAVSDPSEAAVSDPSEAAVSDPSDAAASDSSDAAASDSSDAAASDSSDAAASDSSDDDWDEDATVVDLPSITAAMAAAHAAANTADALDDATEPELQAVSSADLIAAAEEGESELGQRGEGDVVGSKPDGDDAPEAANESSEPNQAPPDVDDPEGSDAVRVTPDTEVDLAAAEVPGPPVPDETALPGQSPVSDVIPAEAEVGESTGSQDEAETGPTASPQDSAPPIHVDDEAGPETPDGLEDDGLEELALFDAVDAAGSDADERDASETSDELESDSGAAAELESLDALAESLSLPHEVEGEGSSGAATREEERERLKDLRQEFSVVAELEAAKQKRALMMVLVALGLGALVALLLFIDANTQKPDVKAEFSGIKKAPGIHRPKYSITEEEQPAAVVSQAQDDKASEGEETKPPDAPDVVAAPSPKPKAKTKRRNRPAKRNDRAMDRYKNMSAKDFEALTSKGGASEFKLPEAKPEKKRKKKDKTRAGGSERAAAISKVIGKKKMLLARCASGVEDKVRVTFTVGATGKVTSIKVSGTGNDRKRNCIRGVLKGSIFPKGSKAETFSQSFRI